MREHERDIEIETAIEITVKVRGRYTPGAPPTPQRGEAVAVECPGWDEGIDDFEVSVLNICTMEPIDITAALDPESMDSSSAS